MANGPTIHPRVEPIPLDHPHLSRLLAELGPKALPELVAYHSDYRHPFAYCYWNVLSVVEKHGGAIVFGWMLYQWPERYLAAEHHAVWRSPEGHLLDVTTPPLDWRGTHTLFVTDIRQDYSLDRPPNIALRRVNLSLDSVTQELAAAYKAKHRTTEEYLAYLYRHRFRWDASGREASRNKPLMDHEADAIKELQIQKERAAIRMGDILTLALAQE